MYVHVNCMIEQLPIVWYHDIMRCNAAYLCYIYAWNQMNLIMFKTSCKLPRYLIQQNLRFSLKRKNCRFFAHCWACGPSDQWVMLFVLTPYVWSFPLVVCEWNVHALPSDCRIYDCTMVCLKCISVFTYQYDHYDCQYAHYDCRRHYHHFWLCYGWYAIYQAPIVNLFRGSSLRDTPTPMGK